MSLIFPKWTNALPAALGAGGTIVSCAVIGIVWYYFTPKFWSVGYEPVQPVNYSHQIHVGKLGMDCRYCHTNVEKSPNANVPDTNTCMNCHTGVGDTSYLSNTLWKAHKENPNLVRVRAAAASGEPIQWRRVHKIPDYANFTHAAHVNAGVSCYSCHGRIDQQAVVRQVQSLAMGFCLECHRNPEAALVDTRETRITDLAAIETLLGSPGQTERGLKLAREKKIQPPQHCAACHY